MDIAAQPTTATVLAQEAAQLNGRPWGDVWAGIPASHPRNENPGGAPAAAGGGGQGGDDPGGGGGGGDDLYQPYLASVPAELHPMVLEPLRAQSADFTRRFQEAAQFRQQMEPYQQIEGFADVPPEELNELIQFRQVLANPEALKEWVGQVGQALGVSPELDEDAWDALGRQNGWLEDPNGGGQPGGDDQAGLRAMFEEMLAPVHEFMGQQQQTQQQREQTEAAQRATQEFQSRFDALSAEHGLVPEGTSPEDAARIQAHVVALAHGHLQEDDPIGAAVQQYLEITGQAQGNLIDTKLQQQHGTALNGGNPAQRVETPSWNGSGPSPKDLALARMRPQ